MDCTGGPKEGLVSDPKIVVSPTGTQEGVLCGREELGAVATGSH